MAKSNPTMALKDGEIVGEAPISGVTFRTKPLPWYARHVGTGSIAEFGVLALFAAFSSLFPKPQTKTELQFDYSGTLYCAHNPNKLAFIACYEQGSTRKLTHVLRCYPASALISCETDLPRSAEVRFTFDTNEEMTLHFIGNPAKLKSFVASANSTATTAKYRG